MKTKANSNFKATNNSSISQLGASNSKAAFISRQRRIPVRLSIWNIVPWGGLMEITIMRVPRSHSEIIVNIRMTILVRWIRALKCLTINRNTLRVKPQAWWILVQLEGLSKPQGLGKCLRRSLCLRLTLWAIFQITRCRFKMILKLPILFRLLKSVSLSLSVSFSNLITFWSLQKTMLRI